MNQPKKRKPPPRKKLDVGQIILSEKDTYTIESVLGSGGFGDVYKVVSQNKPDTKYAMKTEYFDEKKRKLLNRLKVEMGVFAAIAIAEPQKRKHFLHMADKGKTNVFKYIVMDIVSYSLEDIRRWMLKCTMTWSTAIRVALQTLSAISDLHSVGYIHRDIKPHNFAIGTPPKNTMIFMLDFGISRRYLDKDGKIRIPRSTVAFLGTIKFASRACHREKEQSRRDDVEVWAYMVLELLGKDNLVWRTQTDRSQIVALKEKLFTSAADMDLFMPAAFLQIIKHIGGLNFADKPDYELCTKVLWECATKEKLDMMAPLDWIGKVMPEKKKPPPKVNKASKELKSKSKSKSKSGSELKESAKRRKDVKKKDEEDLGDELEADDDDFDDSDDDKDRKLYNDSLKKKPPKKPSVKRTKASKDDESSSNMKPVSRQKNVNKAPLRKSASTSTQQPSQAVPAEKEVPLLS